MSGTVRALVSNTQNLMRTLEEKNYSMFFASRVLQCTLPSNLWLWLFFFVSFSSLFLKFYVFFFFSGPNVKSFFSAKIIEKAEQYLGVAMTYTLIELVKDNVEVWFTEVSKYQPETSIVKDQAVPTKEISNLVRATFYLDLCFKTCMRNLISF